MKRSIKTGDENLQRTELFAFHCSHTYNKGHNENRPELPTITITWHASKVDKTYELKSTGGFYLYSLIIEANGKNDNMIKDTQIESEMD